MSQTFLIFGLRFHIGILKNKFDMYKILIRPIIIASIIVTCLSACEGEKEWDPYIIYTYSIVDSLSTDASITCSFSSSEYDKCTLLLKPLESYTYYHGSPDNYVEPGKIPVYSADTLSIFVQNRPVIEFTSREEHFPLWKFAPNHTAVFVIEERLWE